MQEVDPAMAGLLAPVALQTARLSPSEAAPERSRYELFCRPRTAELLRQLRLDHSYHLALGDRLYYMDAGGVERSVVDFIGGYGASLFGHNHPELCGVLVRALEQGVPFNAQLSRRDGAGQLAEELDRRLHAATGRHFVVTLANSGAEAVEAALKHAELSRRQRLEALADELARLRAKLSQGEHAILLHPSSAERAEALLGGSHAVTTAAVVAALAGELAALRARAPRFCSLEGAFHGKTGAALQLTYNERYRAPFAGLGPEVRFVRFGDVDDLARVLAEGRVEHVWFELEGGVLRLRERTFQRTAALFVEPIQGEGGIREMPEPFLRACRALASEHGVPLVFDEIQCGMGRSGDFLASSASGAVADYYLLGKSLGGGLTKISALLVERAQYEPDFGLIHSSTFAEDEHSARVATRALGLLDSARLMENARWRGQQILDGLEQLRERFPLVIEQVTGRGLMIGLRLCAQSGSRASTLRMLSARGLLGYVVAGYLLHEHRIRLVPTLSDTHVLRIEPSAFVGDHSCTLLLRSLEALCCVLERQNAHHLTRYLVQLEQPGTPPKVADLGPPRPPRAPERAERTEVAFVGHLIGVDDMVHSDASLAPYTLGQRRELLDRVWTALGPAVVAEARVTSATGAEVDLQFIGLYVDSRIIAECLQRRDLHVVRRMVSEAVAIAEERGCRVLGLGGYTSIVTRNGTRLSPHSLALTTGNSLTVAMGLEALLQAARARGIDIRRARFAAVGAAGNIGSVYSELMAEHVGSVTLIGRPHSEPRLRQLACTIRARSRRADPVPIRIATDLRALHDADLVVVASSDPARLIFPRHLGPQPVVICDISAPLNTDESVQRERPDVTVIQGGLVQLGDNPSFQIPGIPLEPGTAFACMAETLLLGLENIQGHFSHGPVEPERVKQIARLARRHGFRLARPKTSASY
jgi:acetylornithine/succinyldiaminopimelate/putrescine aminotransferase/predicted amino acid dehydrogenase